MLSITVKWGIFMAENISGMPAVVLEENLLVFNLAIYMCGHQKEDAALPL